MGSLYKLFEMQFVGGPYDGWVYDLRGVVVTDGTPWYHDMKSEGKLIGRYCRYRFDASSFRMVYDGTFAGSFAGDHEYIRLMSGGIL